MNRDWSAGNHRLPLTRLSIYAWVSINHTLILGLFLAVAGCASVPERGNRMQRETAALSERLRRLDETVDADEAVRLAADSIEASASLAHEYRAVRPAWLHNWFVNAGWRERGLCYEWANDLFPRLSALKLRTLELHLAVARMDTPREHNSIVVTARGQSFEQGVVLDAWRHSGRLWFGEVASDKYPWHPLPSDRVAPELQKVLQQ